MAQSGTDSIRLAVYTSDNFEQVFNDL